MDTEKCFGCTHCMKSCPTEAIRIVDGIAVIDAGRCVDCGNCLRACPVDAIYVVHDGLSQIESYKYRVVLFPSVFIGQFAEVYSEGQIYEALLKLGFTHIFEVEQPVEWLMESIKESRDEVTDGPLISSFCPAIVRLIQCKYPSLVNNISHRKAPHDLAAHFAIQQLKAQGASETEIGIFYITPCSAKMAAVKQPVAEKKSIVTGIINMKDLYNRIMKLIPKHEHIDTTEFRKYLSKEGILWCLPRGETSWYRKKTMAIDGIHNVVKFLERLENNDVPQFDFLELKSCNQGCAGGILLTGNRFLTVERLQKRAARYPRANQITTAEWNKEDVKEKLISEKIEPRPVFVLDENRVRALDKIQKMNKILCQLPGIDCGGCGAPNCHALAEDIILGKARMSSCVFLQKKYVKEQKIKPEKAYQNLEKIWGEKRFDADCNKKGGRNEGF
ncbi:[Fe-Fe] hydrogenase large subunit C-terminal domain-containing protein [Mariniphaga anaerophila]|uniref:[Fe-Fe] hydrogenase large subunit C-terminal domain-containing protein n=1 Tax=Mariniphaga anaerophila TaxID=1484053 RepID=UPI00158729E0|nr:[Fe-Fe] hydrogenase large subunit C-terminal domain-containing protein [Mariniphaga anaerophila]